MTAQAFAHTGYGANARTVKTPRDIEYDILARITGQLEKALADTGPTGFPALAAAVEENKRLWTAFAVDLAEPGNRLPGRVARAAFLSRAVRDGAYREGSQWRGAGRCAGRHQPRGDARPARSEGRRMTGLILKLAPHERVLINGAVIENGDKRSRFSIITPNAHILRLRDAIHPEQANTPVRRVCYIAQLVLSGDADPEEARPQLLRGIEQLSQVLTDHDSRTLLTRATDAVLADEHYPALRALRGLLPREERLMAQGRQ
jgi:flagellar biosynthesis repressor protein FlbT